MLTTSSDVPSRHAFGAEDGRIVMADTGQHAGGVQGKRRSPHTKEETPTSAETRTNSPSPTPEGSVSGVMTTSQDQQLVECATSTVGQDVWMQVEGFPTGTTEKDVWQILSQRGCEILAVTIRRMPPESEGCDAYIHFASPETAEGCARLYENTRPVVQFQQSGRGLHFSYMTPEMQHTSPESATDEQSAALSTPSFDVWMLVENFPVQTKEKDVWQLFSEYAEVLALTVTPKPHESDKCDVYVRFASLAAGDECAKALEKIRPTIQQYNQCPRELHFMYVPSEIQRLRLHENSSPLDEVAKVFVGSLPPGTTDSQLRSLFSPFGQIVEVLVIENSRKALLCGFVKYTNKEDAIRAIVQTHGTRPLPNAPRGLVVRMATIRNGPSQQQKNQGDNNRGGNNRRMPAALAFSQTHVQGDGARGSSGVWNGVSSNQANNWYDVHLSNNDGKSTSLAPNGEQASNVAPNAVGSQTHGPPGANIFIFHIPNGWTDNDLVRQFYLFGHIVSARIASCKQTGRCLGYGFVSFSNIESAVTAVDSLNGYPVAGKKLKVTIKRGEEHHAEPYRVSMKQLLNTLPAVEEQSQHVHQQAELAQTQSHPLEMQGGYNQQTVYGNQQSGAAGGMAPTVPVPQAHVQTLPSQEHYAYAFPHQQPIPYSGHSTDQYGNIVHQEHVALPIAGGYPYYQDARYADRAAMSQMQHINSQHASMAILGHQHVQRGDVHHEEYVYQGGYPVRADPNDQAKAFAAAPGVFYDYDRTGCRAAQMPTAAYHAASSDHQQAHAAIASSTMQHPGYTFVYSGQGQSYPGYPTALPSWVTKS